MRLRILGSDSSGNCYIFENKTQALIVECGVPFPEIKRALDWDISKVVGALISHEHKDHCKSAEEVALAGIKIYCSSGTSSTLKISPHRLMVMKNLNKYFIGQFSVMPFDVKHDAKEPFGFMINHPSCGNVLFITDSYYVPHTFKNLNQVIVEANYSKEIVAKRLEAGSIHGKVRDRVIESHMSIETCKDLLKANDLSQVNNIILIHLSDGNSNAADFKRQVEDLTGKKVHVADKGMEIDLSKTPF